MPDRAQTEPLRRLMRRIEPDAFADRVLDSYWNEADHVGPREARRHAHMWVRWNLDVFVRWLIAARPPTEEELEVLRSRARRQAQDGIPADYEPANVRRAARFAWNAALEVADEQERAALLESADLLFEFIDRVSRIHAEAHAESERTAPLPAQERLARGALTRLARVEPPTGEDVDLATELGVSLDGTVRPIVIALADAGAADHLELAARLRARGALAISEGRWVVALVAPRVEHERFELPRTATIAAGDLTDRERLLGVLTELRMLVDLAHSHGDAGLVAPNRYLVEQLLRTAPPVASRLRHEVFGPLRALPELARTLDCLVEHNFNRQRTAAALPVHRNTLRSRLERLAELTGLDLDDPDDRGLAWLAHLCAPPPPRGVTNRSH